METTTKKVKKPAAAKAAEETAKKAITQKVIVNKVLKYVYPKGCTNTLDRKAFRQKVRNSLRKMERDLTKLKGDALKEAKEKFQAYQQTVLA